jgi:uncharacterized protein (TIGR03382 family)
MNRTIAIATILAGVCASSAAHAFCGFYVAGGDQKMFNDATQVVLMREGTRTVLAMQNNYQGPPEAFAMVIPVPVVLHEGDVKTLNKELFEHVEQMGAPRLVEYWEQDPCYREPEYDGRADMAVAKAETARPAEPAPSGGYGVKIEAKFVVGEYQIVILSAKDSTGLDGWLKAEKYKIPDGAEPLLRPYVEQGSKFFVAKVDPSKVKFDKDQRAALSPLRFHYDSDEFSLPIRLGLANSSGTQDLIVNILAPHQRYNVANYKNVTIPTNIDVSEPMKDKFAAFYTALFDKTLEKNPGAVVTEYAWQATTCDPCPGPSLMPEEIMTLGGDVLPSAQSGGYDFVLTRLHARYGKADMKDDLRFQKAEPIVGGREHLVANGKLEEGAQPDSVNNFQGRYAVRHRWTGPIACANPRRGVWGGPPQELYARPDFKPTGTKPAVGLAFAPRGQVELAKEVRQDVPELGVKATTVIASPGAPANDEKKPKKTGCGCSAMAEPATGWLAFGVLALVLRRRRR